MRLNIVTQVDWLIAQKLTISSTGYCDFVGNSLWSLRLAQLYLELVIQSRLVLVWDVIIYWITFLVRELLDIVVVVEELRLDWLLV